jgi:hypothetical protein
MSASVSLAPYSTSVWFVSLGLPLYVFVEAVSLLLQYIVSRRVLECEWGMKGLIDLFIVYRR